MRLQGKVAIITGSASGIGRSSALLFASEGAKIVVADLNEAGGQETVQMINEKNGEAIFIKVDVANEENCQAMVKAAEENFGRLDVLFNNAGMPGQAKVEDMTLEQWNRVLDVNLKSVFLASKHAIPVMRKAGGGSIINTSSTAGLAGSGLGFAYSAAKGGVVLLSMSMALALAKDKIRVNALCPAPTDTPMNIRFFSMATDPEAARQAFFATLPMARMAQPEEIAYGALYLASDEASYVTGIALPVDGGFLAR